jgi:very-short-patch-repair endonuclease/KaiC/GvpD/RAD55 family RecA-like ATPase
MGKIMTDIDTQIEAWQKKLLDLGKKNRLINFKETKRSTLRIIEPDLDDFYSRLVIKGKDLEFSYYEKYELDKDGEEVFLEGQSDFLRGDIRTNQEYKDQQATLRNLRYRARTAIEEQGVNILFASFGLLNYKENQNSNDYLIAPLILVPVKILLESISSPFVLQNLDEEIVINPTLIYKLDHDFKIQLPSFEPEDNNIFSYLDEINKLVKSNDWNVLKQVHLGLFSFLKINIYEDISRNKKIIKNHFLVQAIADKKPIENVFGDLDNFDHDEKTSPIDTFQVVDADSSQQDAILFAKKNISFVLQGPPGTGKSQTITNIIAEKLSEGKKVLFVSEKMAALEVVHKRLRQSKLDDFCLTLHSHHANKKQVLEMLRKSISLHQVKLVDRARRELITLSDERKKLNDYVKELHNDVEPLGKTIYQVNSILANLTNVADVIFSITDMRKTDIDKYDKFIIILNELAMTIEKMHEDYSANPWRDFKFESLSFDLRHQIEAVSKKLIPQLFDFSNELETTNSILELSRKESVISVLDLIKILKFAGTSNKIPISWIYKENIFELEEIAEIYKKRSKNFLEIEEFLLLKYEKGYLLLPAELFLSEFRESLPEIQNQLNIKKYPDEEVIISNLEKIISFSKKSIENIQELYDLQKLISQIIDIEKFETFPDIFDVEKLLGYLCENPKPTEIWVENDRFLELKKLFADAKERHEKINSIHKDFLEIFEKEIFDIDYKNFLRKFKSEYNSLFRIFNSNYRHDKNYIRSFALDYKRNFSHGEIITILRTLQVYYENKNWTSEYKDKLNFFFGSYYKGFETSWQDLENSIIVFENIIAYYNIKNIEIPKNKLLEIPNNIDAIRKIANDLKSLDPKALFNKLEIELAEQQNPNYLNILDSRINFEYMLDISTKVKESFDQIINQEKIKVPFKETIEYLNILKDYQSKKSDFEYVDKDLENKFQYFYQDVYTDWETLLSALDWAKNFLALKNKHQLSNLFTKKICLDDDAVSFSNEKHNSINSKLSELKIDLDWFIDLFEPKDDLINAPIPRLIGRIQSCVNNMYNLEEWVDYKSSKNKCVNIGLSNYIHQIELLKIAPNQIVKVFEKQFYRKWLDEFLPEFPTVQSFRGKNHEQTIEKFVRLDQLQQEIAQSRVKERVLANFPNWDSFTSSSNELGILKREINKKRRIMPIRKLFKEIPNLLMTIKPCLMMSPLSVSLFLESEHYNFDLVIFDEASQVRTEDAIGAIFRGQQVIIVGDSKQLPPTNFFSAGTSDGNFDYDDEDEDYYDDSDAFESVLDESVSVLSERTLRWHYRSRHEHLIAFSNAKIYDQSLITFPAVIENDHDIGVDFVYVPDGIYDRGGTRTNQKEAARVAELVFEHFTKTPDRSLGVVTFSLAQSNAIDAALRKLRMEDNTFEEFFNENIEEYFFIKNLESVQGDERDTIIISVGYAKNHNGVLSMNFGPLNRSGGYRRLNVVITRAKYNVKLVSSIQSADILLDNTENEGVRLLRSYLEFAQQGPSSLQNEIKYGNDITLESPFEESVYNFLINNGYDVVTQVGCSGYRIDMGVKHPDIPGRFVLALECDGASYHSARTARERDRLRQMVLEDIGWKFHRIWSTDWIKDPHNEGIKLLNVINESIATYQEPNLTKKKTVNNEEENHEGENNQTTNNYEVKIETINNFENPFNFKYYKWVEPMEFFEKANGSDFEKYLATILHIVNTEFPIHKDLLINRLSGFFRAGKATPTIKKQVISQIRYYHDDKLIIKNDFVWPKNNNHVIVKIPKDGNAIRGVEHISIDELANAMFVIINHSFSIKKEDLFQTTARVFGFKRSGNKINQRLEVSFDYLLQSKKVIVNDEKIMIKKS